MKQEFLIGVDVGGTKIASGIVCKSTGELMVQEHHETPKTGNESILTCIGDSIQTLMEHVDEPITRIGIGIPGLVERNKGIALYAGNLNFRDMAITDYIWNRFKVKSHLENDTNAGTLGEKWFGQAKGLSNFIYIAIGTGIGGGLVFNNKLYIGKNNAGEIGHMIAEPHGRDCVCGLPGCIESLASGTAIARLALERLEEGVPSSLQTHLQQGLIVTAKEVFEAAEQGDNLANEVVAEIGRYLAYTLTSLVKLLDPEAIILAGSVSQSRMLLLDAILNGAPTPEMKENLKDVLRFSQWTNGIIGAASVVLDREGN
jgi:N-acetylglucosamine repressor